MDPTKAPPAKSPAERMRQTTGAAGRGGADILLPGLGPSEPSSSPPDSGSRFAAISAPYSPFSFVIAFRFVCPRVYTRAGAQTRMTGCDGWTPQFSLLAGPTGLTRPSKGLFRSPVTHSRLKSENLHSFNPILSMYKILSLN
jgi:hypothetical protein